MVLGGYALKHVSEVWRQGLVQPQASVEDHMSVITTGRTLSETDG